MTIDADTMTAPAKPIRMVCSDCDGTGIDESRRPSSVGYLHPPSSLCRECGGRGVVTL